MLIFHRFPTENAAVRFASDVLQATEREVTVYFDADEAGRDAVFPFELTAPVALVERFDDLSGEHELEELAAKHGGVIAGT